MMPILLLPPLHNGTFTWDEFLCTGVIAVILVVGALLALRFEKDMKEDAPPPAEEPPSGK